uniref:Phospholipid-transporting ATPase n=1 Tax=Cyprinus carpio TaxID=7962 RepID=A0A8C1TZ23_CYPCA
TKRNFSSTVEEERHVRANDRDYNERFSYADNHIKTAKYNVFTFLPINLFEQFQRFANAYFLVLLILQLIPEISSLSWFTTIVPLVLVLAITAVKDATDDYFRHKSDQQVNTRQSQVLIKGKLQNEKWMNVRVGDIIKLENNQFVAADLLLLSSSEPYGLCYIETAELDGETNLKVRQALTVTSDLGDDVAKLADFNGEVICEPPNNKLDKFTGTLFWKDNKYPLDNEKMLLRGCVLRNTEWCFGLVIFAGLQTKLMQNCGRTKLKRTSIDKLMNTLVLWIFGFLICMGIILAIGNTIWEQKVGSNFWEYLQWKELTISAVFSGFLTFWSYVIILNTVVPISLYVSVEVLRLGHSYFINWDRRMYYSRKATPAEARTTTLNEELGQVEFIFSDKTGTLTQNIMVFNKCSINGKTYGMLFGHKVDITEKTPCVDFSFNPLMDRKFRFHDSSLVEAIKLEEPLVQEFFRLLALCHTIMPEERNEGELVYQAQSPDEGALVTAARNFGFVFRSRTPETITLYEMGQAVTYQLLAILDFNNVRKRMSVIVRNPKGQLKLYSKGADTILFDRLDPSNEELMFTTSEHLNEFAGEGLRTLALAYKDLDEDVFDEWMKKLLFASTALDNREEKLGALYEEIEQGMMLLGATAIEDKLQEGVPETIACLTLANIKIWVLTGDKLETAMNIGYSCNMLRDDMNEVFIISGHTMVEVRQELRMAKERIMGPGKDKFSSGLDMEKTELYSSDSVFEETIIAEYALIINGHSLAHALEADLEQILVDVACLCKTVICCRVTPLQKALVVELIKRHKRAVTLAIGDGANDIGLDTNYWTAVNHFFIWGSLAVYFAILFAMHSDGIFTIFPNQFPFIGTARNSLNQKIVWLVILLTTVVCIMPMVAVRFIKADLYPTHTDKVRLLQQASRRQGPQEQNFRRVRRTSSRRSAYAFAHQQGYGELITSGKNMKVPTASTSTYPLSSPARGNSVVKNSVVSGTTDAAETNSTGFRRESDQNQEVTVEDLEAR